jgi:SAM-dependent methyltransferase
MSTPDKSQPQWGDSYRLVAAEKWKAKSAAMGRHVTEAIVEYAQPKPGMRVLDLASGTGEPAISLASRVGPAGHVTAFDLSNDLLAIAADRASQRALTNFTTQQGDAHHLPFPNQSFDLVTSRFGVMFFSDCVQAMREVHRVLKPSGRAAFLVWGPIEQPYWTSTFGVVAKHVGGPILAPGGPDPFRFGEPGSLPRVLREAGVRDVSEETRMIEWTWLGPPEEVWEYAKSVSTPFQAMLKRVPAQKWDEINREVYEAIGQYVRGDKIEFGAMVHLVSGVR